MLTVLTFRQIRATCSSWLGAGVIRVDSDWIGRGCGGVVRFELAGGFFPHLAVFSLMRFFLSMLGFSPEGADSRQDAPSKCWRCLSSEFFIRGLTY